MEYKIAIGLSERTRFERDLSDLLDVHIIGTNFGARVLNLYDGVLVT